MDVRLFTGDRVRASRTAFLACNSFSGRYRFIHSIARIRVGVAGIREGIGTHAGSRIEVTGALIVNPNDKLEVAEAIRDALQMRHQERITRWQGMIGPLRDRDVAWWAAAFLKELVAQKIEAHRDISKLTQPRLPPSGHAPAPRLVKKLKL